MAQNYSRKSASSGSKGRAPSSSSRAGAGGGSGAGGRGSVGGGAGSRAGAGSTGGASRTSGGGASRTGTGRTSQQSARSSSPRAGQSAPGRSGTRSPQRTSQRTAQQNQRSNKQERRQSGGTVRQEAITVGEQRRRSRRENRKKQGIAWGVRLLIALAVVVVLGVAGIVVYQSPAFSVKTVQVNGANRLTNEYLEQAAAIPADSTLLRLDEKGILERLKDDPWIASAHLERQFPSTLLLVIEERTAAAAVEVYPSIMANEPGYWLISSEGRWLGVVDNDEAPIFIALDEVKDYPLITDIHRLIAPVFGETATDEGIENALAVLVGFSPEMRSLVASVSAPDRNKTALTLTNNVLVMFGAAEDITAKETAIKTLLNEHPDTLISINVRVANRPSFIPYGEE